MDEKDLDFIIIRYGSAGVDELKQCLRGGTLESWKIPYIKELIKQKRKEELKNLPKLLCVRALNFINKTFISLLLPIKAFWLKEWKWILGYIITALTLLLGYLKYLSSP